MLHGGAIVQLLAFVDDTYIIVRSEIYDTDCAKLTAVPNLLMSWANDNNVTFGPHKYTLPHFRGFGETDPARARPDIRELPCDEQLFEHDYIDILGVRVDARLSWVDHIELIITKVSKQVTYDT
ncbi:Uu.00g099700.m01.CDS01 [Anthostomella pinea]|uniref:Uu.00g099700.m01.CDS01 n=1 Tax=Anthostomella pinea TaxID=933095 RepID=A0AAI8YF59_9PEZI|nr:Uu.00g099700.m01.CDS01 [Anthostomella pinea]